MKNNPLDMINLDVTLGDPESGSCDPVRTLPRFIVGDGAMRKEKVEELLDYLNHGFNLSLKATLKDGRNGYGFFTKFEHPVKDLVAFSVERQEKLNYVKKTYFLQEQIQEALSYGSKPFSEEEKKKYRQVALESFFVNKRENKKLRRRNRKQQMREAAREIENLKREKRRDRGEE